MKESARGCRAQKKRLETLQEKHNKSLTLFRASTLRLFCFLRQLDFQFSFVRSEMMLVSMV